MTTHDWTADVDRAHLAAIQDRRDLYGAGGVRHLILEVLSYANDEAETLARVGRARVVMRPNATVTVVDDGRGTDTRTDAEGRVIRKPVMATKDIRFFDSVDSPLLPDGLPRRGMSTVAALSTELVHENHRANGSWSQTYRSGIPEDQLRQLPESKTTGTSVTFRTDIAGPDALTAEDLVAFPWLRVDVDESSV